MVYTWKVQIPIFHPWSVETNSITMKPTFMTFVFHIWWDEKQLECYNIPAVPFLLYSSETLIIRKKVGSRTELSKMTFIWAVEGLQDG